ncbi:MAG: SDR family oxidoreductase [Candidatus Dormibacteria bacterium]
MTGKVALVTGGSQGIGLMISRGLVEAGATVYINSRKAAVCEQAVQELSQSGTCHALPGDVSSEAEVLRLKGELESAGQGLDILVNNAGAAWGAPYAEYPDSAWDKVLGLNVKSVFNLSRTLTPLLEQRASSESPGRIINVGSIDGFKVPALENYAYSASKAAVHHLTRVLSQKLAPRHITVNAIAPGPFPSKMMAATLAEHGDEMRAKNPLGRLGEPEDVAGVTIYLASRAGAYVTGQIIAVDGGFSNQPW